MERYILVDTMRQYPMELENYPEAQDDDEIVGLAVKKNGYALAYASRRLQDDYQIVLCAVKKDGGALAYASDRLRRDMDIISAAIGTYGCALKHVPEDLQQDRGLVLAAAENGCDWELIPGAFQKDKEIVLQVLKFHPDAYPKIPDELAEDLDIILTAIENNHTNCPVTYFLPDTVLGDKEKMLKIVEIDSGVLKYASDELKNDKELALAAIDRAIAEYEECRYYEDGFWPWVPDFSRALWDDPDIQEKLYPCLYIDYSFYIPLEIQSHIEAGNIDIATFEAKAAELLEDEAISFKEVQVIDEETACIIRLDRKDLDDDDICLAFDNDYFWDGWIEELNDTYDLPDEL